MKKIAMLLVIAMLALACPVGLMEEIAGMPNPYVETDMEGIRQTLGLNFRVPEDAQDVKFFIVGGEMAEMQFTDGHAKMTFRMKSEAEFTDISGTYYEWDVEDPCVVGEWAEGVCRRHLGEEETVDVILWFDVVPGFMYSITAQAADLDGFDVEAYAEQIYVPMQDEATGSVVNPEGYDLLKLSDIFIGEGTEDTVIVQGCFGTISAEKGEDQIEEIGFDPEEIRSMIVNPDAAIKLVKDFSDLEEIELKTEELVEWYEGILDANLDENGNRQPFSFMVKVELDGEDNIAAMEFFYMP